MPPISRRHQLLLIGYFLVVIFGVPLTQAAIEIHRGRLPQCLDIFTQAPIEKNLRAFERDLEDQSVYAQAFRPWIRYLWFTAGGNPGEKAVIGEDGWLFYKPDVRYLVEPSTRNPDSESDPLAAILDFRDQLSRMGIRLIVLPVPGKPSVYSEKLTRRAGSGGARADSHTRRLIARLKAAGVEVPELLDAFLQEKSGSPDEPSYLAQDTHWSGRAARRAAEIVAARIVDLGWIERGNVEYGVREVSVRRPGDVLRMISLPRVDQRFPPEEVHCEQVFEKKSGKLYKDEVHSPVLALGDSFLRIYQTDEPTAAGFIAHLARALKFPVASIVNDGGASTLVRQQLSKRPVLLKGKKLVIWEFVERDIRFGAEGWKRVALPAQGG